MIDSFAAGPYDFPELNDKPSSYFHRQMYLTFVDDSRGLEHRHALGVERDHVVHRLPASGNNLAELAGRREKELRRHPHRERT